MTKSSEGPAGLVVVDKPGGMTSHDVVARVRRLAGTRRVGHAGTLDPMATGVLLLGVNRATRLLGHLMLTEKTYDAVVRLGAASTTDDAEGELLERAATGDLDEEQVGNALTGFVGDIEQVPSAVSAIKIDGRRAYQRVRAGEDVDLPARPVTVHQIDLHEVRRTEGFLDVEITVRCSSGTYIRAIARDLGAALGVGGHLTALRRTRVGPFGIDEAATLAQLKESFAMISIDDLAARAFTTRTVDDPTARDIAVGRRLPLQLDQTGPVGLLDERGTFLALYEQRGDVAAPVAVFTG